VLKPFQVEACSFLCSEKQLHLTMGRNKGASSVAKAQGKPQAKAGGKAQGASASAAVTPADSMAPTSSTSTGWLASLTEQEQEIEMKRREEREKKANIAKKKEDDLQRQRESREQAQKAQQLKEACVAKKEDKETKALLARARAEGVLEAVEYDDGCWYAALGIDMWKEAKCSFWCRHCDAHLNLANLVSHLDGQTHRKQTHGCARPLATGGTACSSVGCSAGKVSTAARVKSSMGSSGRGSSSSRSSSGGLEPWQEHDADGKIRCILCDKICDGCHEHTQEHQRKLANFMWEKDVEENGYPTPAQTWLAWVPDSKSSKSERCLKCLLCDKWVGDWQGSSTVGYAGTHGDEGDANQKDHKKKLADLQSKMPWLMTEKAKYHATPAMRSSAPLAAPVVGSRWNKITASSPFSTSFSSVQRQMLPSPVEAVVLACGWKCAKDHESGHSYYYHTDGRVQWAPPDTEETELEEEC